MQNNVKIIIYNETSKCEDFIAKLSDRIIIMPSKIVGYFQL